MINETQKLAFWDLLNALDEVGMLSHVMVIGSWAEFLFSFYYDSGYSPNIRTLDVDILYRNIRYPRKRVDIFPVMRSRGFIYTEDIVSGVGKFVKDGALEVELLTRALGKGEALVEIPSIGIKAPSFRSQNMLNRYPLVVQANGLEIITPEPSVYLLHKLFINDARNEIKREKDRDSIRLLLSYIKSHTGEYARLAQVFGEQPEQTQKRIYRNAQAAHISDTLFDGSVK
jgi:hypothetical protein